MKPRSPPRRWLLDITPAIPNAFPDFLTDRAEHFFAGIAMYSVLLADDSEDDRMLFELAMRKVPGMQLVGTVLDGDQAISYLAGRNEFEDRKKFPFPDLVFLDLKMPRVTGFEVLDWLQNQEPKPFVAVFSGSELET